MKLNQALREHDEVGFDFVFSPDGEAPRHLYSVPTRGGEVVRLTGPAVRPGGLYSWRFISPTSLVFSGDVIEYRLHQWFQVYVPVRCAGNDTIRGGAGADIIRGGSGHDVLRGNRGRDLLIGGPGRDILSGGTYHDTLKSGSGADTLAGNRGNDTLKGNRGNDTLDGRRGSDKCRGGPGTDTRVRCER